MIKTQPLEILLVDDDDVWRGLLAHYLSFYGKVTTANGQSSGEALLMSQKNFDICFFDMEMNQKLAGIYLTKLAAQKGYYSVVISSHEEQNIIMSAYSAGCRDYFIKPATEENIHRVMKKFSLLKKEKQIDELIRKNYLTQDINSLGQLSIIKKIALSHKPVLITGESGTGKMLVADIINQTINPLGPFIKINCAALNESTLMSELFGHVKGAFTGADKNHKGVFEQANGGLLFLDEIHLLSISAQQALLTAIEDGMISPVGSDKKIKIDVRIICASREYLDDYIKQGKFKDDLYFRLQVFQIKLIPLRLRPQDIPLQVEGLLKKYFGQERATLVTDDAMACLKKYSWKNGNTRELEALVEDWFVHSLGVVTKEHLPAHIQHHEQNTQSPVLTDAQISYLENQSYDEFVRLMSELAKEFALKKCKNLTSAAQYLKISKGTLSKHRSVKEMHYVT
ncbi:MAG: sigma-54-dependent Fis family transcriptional regulator [Bacteriovoracaceae bacterium]|nr:sigma-54-dependent Fis family transcriptional regulator [Bacteriovoracaceae bacterium]